MGVIKLTLSSSPSSSSSFEPGRVYEGQPRTHYTAKDDLLSTRITGVYQHYQLMPYQGWRSMASCLHTSKHSSKRAVSPALSQCTVQQWKLLRASDLQRPWPIHSRNTRRPILSESSWEGGWRRPEWLRIHSLPQQRQIQICSSQTGDLAISFLLAEFVCVSSSPLVRPLTFFKLEKINILAEVGRTQNVLLGSWYPGKPLLLECVYSFENTTREGEYTALGRVQSRSE